VVLGASAGGIEALRALFGALSADLDAAFLVVVHIPPHTPSRLGEVLAAATRMPVSTPRDKEAPQRGHVYVACADQHLMLEDGVIRHTRGPKECRVRPAIDVLFRSAAVAYGPRTVGIVLSGMLDDGTAGLWAIKDRGGKAIVQDSAEAMHPQMPESARRHVDVDLADDCAAIARALEDLTRRDPLQENETREKATRARVEARIASEGNALQLGVMDMGKASQYTCPDCHGVLVQIEEGSIVRFRCHTGHAFSLETLLAEISESIDHGLWDTIRAIEERVLLLRQMSTLEAATDQGKSQALNKLADDTEKCISGIKELVMDDRLFGRQA
jgi:two-component system chemotaxis response regulator CheB